MNNLDCWDEIQKLKGRTLKTLEQGKPFQVIDITESKINIVPEVTGKTRPIHRAEIENAYRRLVVTRKITRIEIMRDFSPFNPAYVAAILAELPGVDHFIKPIRLEMTTRSGG